MATRSSHPACIRRRIAALIAVIITTLLASFVTTVATSTVGVHTAAGQPNSFQKPTIVLVHGAFADSSG